MKSPITGKEMILTKEKRSIGFRKESFDVVFHYYKCEDSGEQFTTGALDDVNMNQVYNQYRDLFNIPFPDEIIRIRKKYNLSAVKMDEYLYSYAQSNGFVYTRYADDLTFSASVLPVKKSIGQLKRDIISLIRKSGFKENREKIRIAGPGSKKVVLGLLVDGERPRISRELLKRIDRNLYSIGKYGIEKVAAHDGFESSYGFYNHVSGLMSFIKDVDFERWKKFEHKFMVIR